MPRGYLKKYVGKTGDCSQGGRSDFCGLKAEISGDHKI